MRIIRKRDYRAMCRNQTTEFLIKCLDNPSKFTHPIHMAIIACVLRERGVTCKLSK